MREEESRELCGRLMWHADREHEARLSIVVEQQEMNLFNMLHPTVLQDGNQFCVLYGTDLQSGISGFGDTIRLAIYDFNKQFDKKAKIAPQSAEVGEQPTTAAAMPLPTNISGSDERGMDLTNASVFPRGLLG